MCCLSELSTQYKRKSYPNRPQKEVENPAAKLIKETLEKEKLPAREPATSSFRFRPNDNREVFKLTRERKRKSPTQSTGKYNTKSLLYVYVAI